MVHLGKESEKHARDGAINDKGGETHGNDHALVRVAVPKQPNGDAQHHGRKEQHVKHQFSPEKEAKFSQSHGGRAGPRARQEHIHRLDHQQPGRGKAPDGVAIYPRHLQTVEYVPRVAGVVAEEVDVVIQVRVFLRVRVRVMVHVVENLPVRHVTQPQSRPISKEAVDPIVVRDGEVAPVMTQAAGNPRGDAHGHRRGVRIPRIGIKVPKPPEGRLDHEQKDVQKEGGPLHGAFHLVLFHVLPASLFQGRPERIRRTVRQVEPVALRNVRAFLCQNVGRYLDLEHARGCFRKERET